MSLPANKIYQTNLCNEVVFSTIESTGPRQSFPRSGADRDIYPFCISVPFDSAIKSWIEENIHNGWQDDDLIRFEMITMTMLKYYYFTDEADAALFALKWS